MDAEWRVVILPYAQAGHPGLRRQRREFIDAEFAGVLGMDAVSRMAFEAEHVDPARLYVVEGCMTESREVETSIAFAADPR
jgi:hypothetical protein